jgi:hypothetical protein
MCKSLQQELHFRKIFFSAFIPKYCFLMQYLPTLSNENPREEDSAVSPTGICIILQRIFSSQTVRTIETLYRFIVTVCSNGKGLPAKSYFAKSPRPFSLSLLFFYAISLNSWFIRTCYC